MPRHSLKNPLCWAPLAVFLLGFSNPAVSQSLNGHSITLDGDLEVSSYGGTLRLVELDMLHKAYVDPNGQYVLVYDGAGERKLPIGQKIKEPKRSYTITLKGNTLLVAGKVTGESFNFGFRVKLTPEFETCRLSRNIRYGDPDITHRFTGFYKLGYLCQMTKGNKFK